MTVDTRSARARLPAVELALIALTSWLGASSPLAGPVDTTKVVISGGPDTSGHNYAWTITNNHASPIVYVEFPHYHAGLFFAPEGWSTEGCENQPRMCAASAESPAVGIPRGQASTFRMRIDPRGAKRGEGTVLVRFADETRVNVGGVELPRSEAVADKYAPLIGLGAIFVVWMTVRTMRRAKRRRRATSTASQASLDE